MIKKLDKEDKWIISIVIGIVLAFIIALLFADVRYFYKSGGNSSEYCAECYRVINFNYTVTICSFIFFTCIIYFSLKNWTQKGYFKITSNKFNSNLLDTKKGININYQLLIDEFRLDAKHKSYAPKTISDYQIIKIIKEIVEKLDKDKTSKLTIEDKRLIQYLINIYEIKGELDYYDAIKNLDSLNQNNIESFEGIYNRYS